MHVLNQLPVWPIDTEQKQPYPILLKVNRLHLDRLLLDTPATSRVCGTQSIMYINTNKNDQIKL